MAAAKHAFPGPVLRLAALAVLAAGCVGVAVARWADPRTPPGLPAGADPEAERGRRLDEQLRVVRRRASEEWRTAQDAAAGRLSLAAAAARFRDLNEEDPDFNREAFRRAYPAGSDEESYCREVIAFVRVVLREQPGTNPAVLGRLEAELRARVAAEEADRRRAPERPAEGKD
jgi:hypothetical protein